MRKKHDCAPPAPPASHAYGHVDLSSDADRLVALMEYMGSHPSSKRLFERSRAPIHRDDAVLDVGCGTAPDAEVLSMLVGPNGSVIGIDASEVMVNHAIRHQGTLPQVSFEQGDVRRLRFPNGRFDIVRCMRVLHHLGEGEPARAIAEMARVLKPGGKLIVAEPRWTDFAFFGDSALTGSAVRNEILADFAGHTVAIRLPQMMSAAGLRAVVYAFTRQVDTLVDFDRFYGFETALEAVKNWKERPEDLDRWEASVREADHDGRFTARLSIPVVVGVKPKR